MILKPVPGERGSVLEIEFSLADIGHNLSVNLIGAIDNQTPINQQIRTNESSKPRTLEIRTPYRLIDYIV